MNKDKAGYAVDCHFLKKRGESKECQCLVDFYNSSDISDMCGICPFFKTEAEFKDGFMKRGQSHKRSIARKEKSSEV